MASTATDDSKKKLRQFYIQERRHRTKENDAPGAACTNIHGRKYQAPNFSTSRRLGPQRLTSSEEEAKGTRLLALHPSTMTASQLLPMLNNTNQTNNGNDTTTTMQKLNEKTKNKRTRKRRKPINRTTTHRPEEVLWWRFYIERHRITSRRK